MRARFQRRRPARIRGLGARTRRAPLPQPGGAEGVLHRRGRLRVRARADQRDEHGAPLPAQSDHEHRGARGARGPHGRVSQRGHDLHGRSDRPLGRAAGGGRAGHQGALLRPPVHGRLLEHLRLRRAPHHRHEAGVLRVGATRVLRRAAGRGQAASQPDQPDLADRPHAGQERGRRSGGHAAHGRIPAHAAGPLVRRRARRPARACQLPADAEQAGAAHGPGLLRPVGRGACGEPAAERRRLCAEGLRCRGHRPRAHTVDAGHGRGAHGARCGSQGRARRWSAAPWTT